MQMLTKIASLVLFIMKTLKFLHIERLSFTNGNHHNMQCLEAQWKVFTKTCFGV